MLYPDTNPHFQGTSTAAAKPSHEFAKADVCLRHRAACLTAETGRFSHQLFITAPHKAAVGPIHQEAMA